MRRYLVLLLTLLMVLAPTILGASALTVAQGNSNLASAALTLTLDPNREIEVHWIGLSFTDGAGTITATSETVVFLVVDETDSDYNIELYRGALSSARGAYWMPDHPMRITSTQQVKVTCTNCNSTNYAFATIVYKPL